MIKCHELNKEINDSLAGRSSSRYSLNLIYYYITQYIKRAVVRKPISVTNETIIVVIFFLAINMCWKTKSNLQNNFSNHEGALGAVCGIPSSGSN